MSNPHPHFTEPTTHYWQSILPAAPPTTPPYKYAYPATLPDSRILMLPIRPLPTNPEHAVASLLVNHASLTVVAELSAFLAEKIRDSWTDVEVLVGVPTLGLCVAPLVAEKLGFGM
jgi:hypothetical protein